MARISTKTADAAAAAIAALVLGGELEVYEAPMADRIGMKPQGRKIAVFQITALSPAPNGVVRAENLVTFSDEGGRPGYWRVVTAGKPILDGSASEIGFDKSIPAGARVIMDKFEYQVPPG